MASNKPFIIVSSIWVILGLINVYYGFRLHIDLFPNHTNMEELVIWFYALLMLNIVTAILLGTEKKKVEEEEEDEI